jgi:aryl sulfotransferase
MNSDTVGWPLVPVVMKNALMDTTRWKNVSMREGDVIIASYQKSGTTWIQQIVGQILSNGDPAVEVAKVSPWIEMRLVPPEAYAALEASSQRRFYKSHSPPNAIPYARNAKYIYIGRDGRDICWSLHNHFSSLTDEFIDTLNAVPGRNGPPFERGAADIHDFYVNWMAHDGAPAWSMWDNVRLWWAVKNLPNVKLVHFNDLKRDLSGSIMQLAAFLGTSLEESDLPRIVEHCSFDYMKAHAAASAPRGGSAFVGGARTFINKGTNGRWRDILAPSEIAAYDARAMAELGSECASWLCDGGNIRLA